MASLTPKLTATPGTPPTYNVGMAETFSWIPVEGAERPLYARATYLANPEDIKVSLSAGDLNIGIDTTDLENLIARSNTLLNTLTSDTHSIEGLTDSIEAFVDAIDLSVVNTNLRMDVLTAVDFATVGKQNAIITLLNALTANTDLIKFNTDSVETLVSATNTLLGSLTALQNDKQSQIITLLHAITGTAIEVDLAADQITLNVDQVETLLNNLTATNVQVPGFAIPPYDEIDLSYYGSTNNLSNVSYLKNSTAVMSLSFVYATNPPTTNDELIVNVKKV
jgi:hypothetical protein